VSDVAMTEEQLVEVTHKRRPSAQCRCLKSMGIDHRVRSDGTVLVHRAHYDRLLGGIANAKLPPVKRFEINWEN
jgi:hypothetical protein